MDTCPTVKVADGAGGFYVINEEDFDKATHKLFKGKSEDEPKADEAPASDA